MKIDICVILFLTYVCIGCAEFSNVQRVKKNGWSNKEVGLNKRHFKTLTMKKNKRANVNVKYGKDSYNLRKREKLEDGSSCINNDECKSGVCMFEKDSLLYEGKCEPKRGEGTKCEDDSDCEPGICLTKSSFTWECSMLEDGSSCTDNGDCKSGVCKKGNLMLEGECAPKERPPKNVDLPRTVDSRPCTQEEIESESNDEGPWPCCIGLKSNDCKVHIESVAPDLKGSLFVFKPEMRYTTDFRWDRVRIFVDENGIVYKTPRRG